jgi:hypothetical protein
LARNRNVPHAQEEDILKFMLRTFAATALVVWTVDVGLGATAGARLFSKKPVAAFRLAHPQASKSGRLSSAPRNNAVRTATAAGAQKAGAGAAAVATRNASIVNATAAVPAAPALRGPAFRGAPPPGAAAHDGAVSGTGKHSTSTLAALGGSTTGKGTAVINGTSVRPKPH